ncbi:hypothetical protein HBB16_17265 [Pseudonocardia sp. MCCB 268]|nr:hypothetical protein [Pseudonocardia cytotoxica]
MDPEIFDTLTSDKITGERAGANNGVRLQSINSPDFFIRHQNFEAELMSSTPGFARTSVGGKVPAGSDDAGFTLVRFESINRPNHFLRHTDLRLVLQRDENNELSSRRTHIPPKKRSGR